MLVKNARALLFLIAAAFWAYAATTPPLRAQDPGDTTALTQAIVKYPYTWNHDKTHYNIRFMADGTGKTPKTTFKWRALSPYEVEMVGYDDDGHPNGDKTHIKFTADFTSYTGTLISNKAYPVDGHQVLPKQPGQDQPEQTASATPAPTPPPLVPVSPEMQQKAADLVKTYHNDLVFVTGKDGAGSGFIAAIGKADYLVTNAHVAAGITDAGFKTLDDTVVPAGTAAVAIGRDIFCMLQPAGGTPLEVMQDVESNAGIGDEVVVLGNAEGGGVINTITGRIVGIGADRVEIDAPFVPGNSGSPIIHLKSGKVIGVATYLVITNYDAATDRKNAQPVIHRFGYRIDNVKQWQTVDWRSFYAQAAEMGRIETLTADLGDFFDDLQQNKGSVTLGRHTNPVIKTRIDSWLADRAGNQSGANQSMADENFLSFLKVACQSDVTAARRDMSYDYFQRELADQQKIRDEMSKSFEEIIKTLRN